MHGDTIEVALELAVLLFELVKLNLEDVHFLLLHLYSFLVCGSQHLKLAQLLHRLVCISCALIVCTTHALVFYEVVIIFLTACCFPLLTCFFWHRTYGRSCAPSALIDHALKVFCGSHCLSLL